MRKHIICIRLVAIIVAFPLLFCSCAKSSDAKTADDVKMRELAEILGEDLQKIILPKRENPDALTKSGYVISKKDKSLGTDDLALFFAAYEAKEDCEITIIIDNDSFVVTRLIFIGGTGYYLRYEYDKLNPTSFGIDGQSISGMELEYQQQPPKWTLTLKNGKNNKTLKFVNPV